MKYQFKTSATMKSYNNSKWWIDSGIVREITVEAEDIMQALNLYRDIVREKYYIEISNNALRNKEPMYVDCKNGDTVQIGYVITAKTDFETDCRGWVTQYIDLWVSVQVIVNPFMEV